MEFKGSKDLIWEDTTDIKFDSSCVFGKGICFDGWESLRQEAQTPIGRFAVWKELGKSVWSAYGGDLGYIKWHSFNSEAEAKQWVQGLIKSATEIN